MCNPPCDSTSILRTKTVKQRETAIPSFKGARTFPDPTLVFTAYIHVSPEFGYTGIPFFGQGQEAHSR